MALPKFARRLVFGGSPDTMTPEEAGIYLPTEADSPEEGRLLQIKYSRPGTVPVQDAMITTHHYINYTGGSVDTTWIDADFLAVESAFDTFFGSVLPYINADVHVDQYRWYKFSKELNAPGNSNPPVRITEKDHIGTASNVDGLPPQVAFSVTEKTALRKHWGRFYLPLNAKNNCGVDGYAAPSMVAAVATASKVLYEACFSADIRPVVWSRKYGHAYGVEKIQVDNIFDVIRRRRIEQPTTRIVYDATT